jgi:hypothetical protein
MSAITNAERRPIRSEKIRNKMTADTEDFLGQRLNSKGRSVFPGQWRGIDGESHPYRHAKDGRRGVHVECYSGRRSTGVGTLIPVPSDEYGHVGRDHLSTLVERLFSLARGWQRDNVLLDLSGVRSVTPTFLKVVDSFRRHLEWQNRDVYLYDARQPNARLRNLREIECLAHVSVAETDFESLPLGRHAFGFERFF